MAIKDQILSLLLILSGIWLLVIASHEQEETTIVPPSVPTPTIKGDDVEGMVIEIVNPQGQRLDLKISDVERDPQDPEQETYLYTVLVQNAETSEWQNLCLPDANNVSKAIPLSGTWDETGTHRDDDKITFACTNGVLAKCVRWGYKPWKTVNGESLQNYHQACTRMARADYCGQGTSYTKSGTPIDLYDRLGIQQPTPNSGMVFEAAWSPEGAVLLNRTRYPDTLPQLQKECPEKLQTILQEENRSIAETDVRRQVPEALLFNRSFGNR